MNDKDKLEEWKRQIKQAEEYGLFFDRQTVAEMVEMIERYGKALKQIVDMEYGDLEWSVITTIYEDISEDALKG